MPEEDDRLTDAAYLQEMLRGWIDTRMERDRTLVTLSAGGIGGLVTLLSTVGPSSNLAMVLYILAGTSFVAALACGVAIFGLNARYLERVIRDGVREPDPILDVLDRGLILSFAVGVVLSGAIGIGAGLDRLSVRQQEGNVAEPKVQTQTVTPDGNKSLSGAGGLRPAPATTTVQPAAPAPAPASTGTSTGGGGTSGAGGTGSGSAGGGK